MINLGKKHDMDQPSIDGESTNKVSYPSLYVPLDLVKGKTIGDVCRIEIRAKIVGLRENEATLDVMKGQYIGKSGKVTKDEYKSMRDEDRESYDMKKMDDDEDDSE